MLTELQRAQRSGRIGSSDAAAILGLDPFKSASDLWLEKTGQAEGFAGNEATERGNLLEPVLIKYAAQRLGWKNLGLNRMYVHPSEVLVCNLDACTVDETEIIEAKSTVMGEEWGEDGTDQIPDRVNVQIAHQFACVPSARVAWIPVLLPGFKKFDWRLYRVERNDELVGIVEKSGIDFMERFVIPAVQPDDYRPSLEVLKRVRRTPNKIVTVADEIVERYLAAKAAEKAASDECEKAQSYLLASLGDAEGGTFSGGQITYMETTRKAYEVKETTFRQLRIKKAK